ncbi:MAG TPA: YSIRK-type signal peptide-containing protein, partial [Lachnospiraceae bacterium]
MREIIEEKKQRGRKQPKYSLRKLTIGLVSCMIGCSVMAIPVLASEEGIGSPSLTTVVESPALESETEIKEDSVAEEIVSTEVTVSPNEATDMPAVEALASPEEIKEEIKEEVKEEVLENSEIATASEEAKPLDAQVEEKNIKRVEEIVAPLTKLYEKPEEITNDKMKGAVLESNQEAKKKLPEVGNNIYDWDETFIGLHKPDNDSKEKKLAYAKYHETYLYEGISEKLTAATKKNKEKLQAPDKILKEETREALRKEKEALEKAVEGMSKTEELVKSFYNKLKEVDNKYTGEGFNFQEQSLGKVISTLEESAKEYKKLLAKDFDLYDRVKAFNDKLKAAEDQDKKDFKYEQEKALNKLASLAHDVESLLENGDKGAFTGLLSDKHKDLRDKIKQSLDSTKKSIEKDAFVKVTETGYKDLNDKVEEIETELYALENYYLVLNLEEEMSKEIPLETEDAKAELKTLQDNLKEQVDT